MDSLPKLSEFALDEQAILLGILFDQMPMGVAIFNRQQALLRCNPTWSEFAQRYTSPQPRKISRGMHLGELIPGNEAVFDPIFNSLLRGNSIQQEALRLESGGVISYWDITALPIMDAGQVDSVLFVWVDATRRTTTIQELHDLAATLHASQERLNLVLQATNDGIWDWDIASGEIYFSTRWKSMLGYGEADIGNTFRSWRDLIHPDDLDRSIETIQSYLDERLPTFQLEHRLQYKNGDYRWILARAVALRNENGLAYRLVGSNTDITGQKRAEAEIRHQEAERRRQVAEGMAEMLNAINSTQSLDEILDFIVSHACRLMGSDAAAIFSIQADSGTLQMQSACGIEREFFTNLQAPIDSHPPGLTRTNRQPVAIADLPAAVSEMEAGDSRLPFLILPFMQDFFHRHQALLSAPVMVKNEIYGTLNFYQNRVHQFSDEDLQLATTLANQVALAIETTSLRQQSEQSAALAERNRLARELHDSVTQSLYSVTLYAEAANRLLASGNVTEAANHVRELRETAQEALREMRLLIFELRPLVLSKIGLAAALRSRLESVESRGGIQTELIVEGAEKLPYLLEEELYQVATEALNNLLKHAHAHHVTLRLVVTQEQVRLEISDDGVGFNLAMAESSGGFGLAGMRERAQRLGGHLQIATESSLGTKISLDVPLSSNNRFFQI
jgi:PAS domain S-box-containing protein